MFICLSSLPFFFSFFFFSFLEGWGGGGGGGGGGWLFVPFFSWTPTSVSATIMEYGKVLGFFFFGGGGKVREGVGDFGV